MFQSSSAKQNNYGPSKVNEHPQMIVEAKDTNFS